MCYRRGRSPELGLAAHPLSRRIAALRERPMLTTRRGLHVAALLVVQHRLDHLLDIHLGVPQVADEDDAILAAVMPHLLQRQARRAVSRCR